MSISQPLISITAALALLIASYKLAGRWIRSAIIIPKFTVWDDLPDLGKIRQGGRMKGQAVVCGGSVAGILAAAVLADHYEEAVIVEPEPWVSTQEGINLDAPRETRLTEKCYPDLVNKRTRVMQTTSFHGYLPPLGPILQHLFPNFERVIDELGLSSRLGCCDYNPHISGRPGPRNRPASHQDYLVTYVTRPAFEPLLRRCLLGSRKNLRHVVGTVTGVLPSLNNPTLLDGVEIRTFNGAISETAAIVVDATGATQTGLKWLQKTGLEFPPSKLLKYTPNVTYSSITLVVPPYLQERLPIPGGWNKTGLIYWYLPDLEVETRALIITVAENSIMSIWTGGWELEAPPLSFEEFKDFASTLVGAEPLPQYIFDLCDILIEHIDELDPAYVIKKLPPSSYPLYQELSLLPGFPSNFVALGDAAMTVNPFFGQGCSKAAFGAVTLDRTLRRLDPQNDRNFASAFFKKQSDRSSSAWSLCKDIDYMFESTVPVQGETLAAGAFGRWLGKQVTIMSMTDAELYWRFWEVRWLLRPLTDIMTPSILIRAAWTWLTN